MTLKLREAHDRIQVLDGDISPSQVLRAIAECAEQDDPFFVCDLDDLVFKYKQWKSLLPRVVPYYAMKCNDAATVLEVVAALGLGFDCETEMEIDKILSIHVDPSRIIYAHATKQDSHIRYAAARGVNLTTFDNAFELHKMKKLHPTCRLLLRFRCDAQTASCDLGCKFGCDPVKEGPKLLKLAQNLGLNVVGVTFDVGSGCGDPPVFRKAIAHARDLFDLGISLGINMTLLDIGGGFPGDNNVAFATFADVINSSLDQFFPSPDVQVYAEPGHYFVHSAFTLATKVHSKREIYSENGELSHVMYYINDGVFGTLADSLYEGVSPGVSPFNGVPLNPSSAEPVPSSVWGPTRDKAEGRALLPPLSAGEWLVYRNMGAYSLCAASPSNGCPVPKVHYVASRKTWLLLKDTVPSVRELFVQCDTADVLGRGL